MNRNTSTIPFQVCANCRHFHPPEIDQYFGYCRWVDGMAQLFVPVWLQDHRPIRDHHWGNDCKAWKPKEEERAK